MSLIISDEIKARAEVYIGHEICHDKCKSLLTENGLPDGLLLPLKDIVECGHDNETGFVWVVQNSETEHRFDQIGKLVSCATEVTAVVEKNKITKLDGVKFREMLVWVKVDEISVDEDNIAFKTPIVVSCSVPVSAFRVAGDEVEEVAQTARDVFTV